MATNKRKSHESRRISHPIGNKKVLILLTVNYIYNNNLDDVLKRNIMHVKRSKSEQPLGKH